MSGDHGMKKLSRLLMRYSIPLMMVLGLGAVWLSSARNHLTPQAGSTMADRRAPALQLTDDIGRRFNLADQRGRVVLVYFGYSTCPDICPTTLAAMQTVWQRLGADQDRFRLVFVTLDPAHDTAPVLHEYLANFPPAPLGLTGAVADITEAANAWGVEWHRAADPRFIDHTSVIQVVGPDGGLKLRFGYSQLSDPAAVAHDLLQVLHAG